MIRNRLYLPEPLAAGLELEMPKELAHYIGRVLRLKRGDAIAVFNGQHGEWLATIVNITRESVRVQLEHALESLPASPLHTHLVQGISRGDRMDFVVQKATELGVERISPVLTAHGVVRLDEKRAAKRREHWASVAVSASEQCGRVQPPRIDDPIPLNDWFGRHLDLAATRILLAPGASLRLADIGRPKDGLCLLIGPEGGLSEREFEDAIAAGFTIAALGPRVLRTETAAVAALSVAQVTWGDL